MVSISLTGIDEQGNHFFPLLGALALSPSHGEVGGRLFLCGGTPLPGTWEGSSTEYVWPYARLTRSAYFRTDGNHVLARFLPPAIQRRPECRGFAQCLVKGSYLSQEEV
jgi:hypothetical protein